MYPFLLQVASRSGVVSATPVQGNRSSSSTMSLQCLSARTGRRALSSHTQRRVISYRTWRRIRLTGADGPRSCAPATSVVGFTPQGCTMDLHRKRRSALFSTTEKSWRSIAEMLRTAASCSRFGGTTNAASYLHRSGGCRACALTCREFEVQIQSHSSVAPRVEGVHQFRMSDVIALSYLARISQ